MSMKKEARKQHKNMTRGPRPRMYLERPPELNGQEERERDQTHVAVAVSLVDKHR